MMSCVTARRANQQKPVESLARKYSAFVLTQIRRITPPVSRQMRDARERHERAVRCGGRRGRSRRGRLTRTVKSCGSDVAVLALRPGEAKLLWDNGGKRAVLRGEHEVSRKAIAQERYLRKNHRQFNAVLARCPHLCPEKLLGEDRTLTGRV